MPAFRSVKRSAAGRRRNSRGQLMSRADVERVDAAAGAASLAAGALAVAAENGGVGGDDPSKTIIWCPLRMLTF